MLFHANMALLGICNSAVYAFCAALQEEKKRSAVRINEVRAAHALRSHLEQQQHLTVTVHLEADVPSRPVLL